jgi:hypothetical protein
MTDDEIEARIRTAVAAERMLTLQAVNDVLGEKLAKLEQSAAEMQRSLAELRAHQDRRPLRIVN